MDDQVKFAGKMYDYGASGRWGYENGKQFLRRNTINDTRSSCIQREESEKSNHRSNRVKADDIIDTNKRKPLVPNDGKYWRLEWVRGS